MGGVREEVVGIYSMPELVPLGVEAGVGPGAISAALVGIFERQTEGVGGALIDFLGLVMGC